MLAIVATVLSRIESPENAAVPNAMKQLVGRAHQVAATTSSPQVRCRGQCTAAALPPRVNAASGIPMRSRYPPLEESVTLPTDAAGDVVYDAIVIGAGVGGLSAAAQMVSKGANVLVLEKYLIPGGSASHFKRDGYTFDVGSSMMFGFGERGTTNLITKAMSAVNKKLEVIPDPSQVKYHMPAYADHPEFDDFINEMVSKFPHEEAGIKAFYKHCWNIFSSLEEPLYLMGQFFKQPLACLTLASYLTANAGDMARKYIKDEHLLKMIDIECFVFSTVPAVLTPMINAGMVLSDRFYGGVNYPKGGVGTIPKALAEGVVDFGGKIIYKANVRHIIIEEGPDGVVDFGGKIICKANVRHIINKEGPHGAQKAAGMKLAGSRVFKSKSVLSSGCHPAGAQKATGMKLADSRVFKSKSKATGVKLADGRVFKSKSVLSNATRWDTFGHMMGEAKMPKAEKLFRQRYKKSPSFFSLHMGVDASVIPKDTDVHHIILEEWSKMEEAYGTLFISMPSLLDPSLAPEGKHVVHAFTPDWMHSWSDLSPAEYARKKEEVADAICERLEKALPGLRNAIEFREVGTPRTHRRYLGREDGTYGPIPAKGIKGIVGMPLNRTAVSGLYCVGDSTFPGQGVNAVAMSGIGCAHRVMCDIGLQPALPRVVDDAFFGAIQFFRDRA
eukprot:gene18623-25138_t